MAKQEGMWITGSFNSVVFYKLGDQYIARSKPKKVRKTRNMKRRNENFGRASSLAASFRHALTSILPNPADRKMQARLTGAFSNWLGTSVIKELPSARSVPFVSEYCFAAGQPTWEAWLGSFQVSQETDGAIVRFSCPSLPYTARTASAPTSIQLKISLASVNIESKQCAHSYHQVYEFTLPGAADQVIELKMPVSSLKGHISIIAATVMFQNDESGRTKKKLLPISRVVHASFEKV